MKRTPTTKLHELLKRLGQAVHGSVVNSDEVRRCLGELSDNGWTAVMLLEAAVTCRNGEVSKGPASLRLHIEQGSDKVEYLINAQDVALLSSLGISPSRHHSPPSQPRVNLNEEKKQVDDHE